MLKINNYAKLVTADEFFDTLPVVEYHADEPHANLTMVPLYFLSKLAREQVKVVLSGEGSEQDLCGCQKKKSNLMDLCYDSCDHMDVCRTRTIFIHGIDRFQTETGNDYVRCFSPAREDFYAELCRRNYRWQVLDVL